MALVLNVREGKGFTVGEEEFVVSKLLGPASYEVTRSSDDKTFKVLDDMTVEVAEDVMLGAQQSTRGSVKVVIDAPRSLAIHRGLKDEALV